MAASAIYARQWNYFMTVNDIYATYWSHGNQYYSHKFKLSPDNQCIYSTFWNDPIEINVFMPHIDITWWQWMYLRQIDIIWWQSMYLRHICWYDLMLTNVITPHIDIIWWQSMYLSIAWLGEASGMGACSHTFARVLNVGLSFSHGVNTLIAMRSFQHVA